MTNVTYQNLEHRGLSGFFRKQEHIIEQLLRGHRTGLFFFDDFMQGGAAESSTAFAWTGGGGNMGPMRYLAHGTASSVIKQLQAAADDEIGVLTLDADADNDETYLTFDSTYNSAFCKVADGADARPFWFEGRVRFSNIASATATVAKMFGLRANVAAATLDIPDGGATIKVEEYVGFRALSGDGDGMDAIYMDDAEVVHVEAASNTALNLTADAWKQFGLHFDGRKLWYYVDGSLASTTGVLPTATNMPNDEPLKPYFGGRLDGTDAANHLDIDWWAFLRLDDLHIQGP